MKKILIASLAVLSLSACQPEPEAPELTLEQIEAAQMDPGEVNIEQIPQTREQLEQKDRELTAEVMRQAKYVDLKPVGAPPPPAAESKAPSNADAAP